MRVSGRKHFSRILNSNTAVDTPNSAKRGILRKTSIASRINLIFGCEKKQLIAHCRNRTGDRSITSGAPYHLAKRALTVTKKLAIACIQFSQYEGNSKL